MRRWLTARTLALGVVALALMTVLGGLGWWQFTTYRQHQAAASASALHERPIPLDTVLGRDAPFPVAGVGKPVTASGRYDAAGQFYVRHLRGASAAYAVVTPLTTDTGSMILVVRGASATPSAPVPSGRVIVQGVLEPSQAVGAPLDQQRITNGIRIASVLATMKRDLYAGYVVLTTSTPADALPIVRPPDPQPSPWDGVRNLIYAIQWWIFAGFVGFMWWRIVSEDSQTRAVGTVGYGRSP
jgi:surfeit locus 1 family protein